MITFKFPPPPPLPQGKKTAGTCRIEGGWAPPSLRTVWKAEISLTSAGNRNLMSRLSSLWPSCWYTGAVSVSRHQSKSLVSWRLEFVERWWWRMSVITKLLITEASLILRRWVVRANHNSCLQQVNFAPEVTVFTTELQREVRNSGRTDYNEATESSVIYQPRTYFPRPPAYSSIYPTGRSFVLWVTMHCDKHFGLINP